jgi:hypothetical protein
MELAATFLGKNSAGKGAIFTCKKGEIIFK